MKLRHENGFTLIELMITVAIVAILAAIAYPSYRNQIMRSNRTVAKNALMTYAQTLEKCFTQSATYFGCGGILANTGTFDSGKNLYAIAFNPALTAANGTTGFTLEATAQVGQLDDTACARFRIDNTGQPIAFTSASVRNDNTCWR